MLGVNERREATHLLGIGNDMENERGLARRLGAEDFNHATARHTAHADGKVKGQGARRDRGNVLGAVFIAKPHDGAIAELLLDLCENCAEGCGEFSTGFFFRSGLGGHVMRFLSKGETRERPGRGWLILNRTFVHLCTEGLR